MVQHTLGTTVLKCTQTDLQMSQLEEEAMDLNAMEKHLKELEYSAERKIFGCPEMKQLIQAEGTFKIFVGL